MGIVSILAAGFVALASQAGQSIQQWANSPSGKKAINNAIQTVGQVSSKRSLRSWIYKCFDRLLNRLSWLNVYNKTFE